MFRWTFRVGAVDDPAGVDQGERHRLAPGGFGEPLLRFSWKRLIPRLSGRLGPEVFFEIQKIGVHCRVLPSLGLGFELLRAQLRLCFQHPPKPRAWADVHLIHGGAYPHRAVVLRSVLVQLVFVGVGALVLVRRTGGNGSP